MAMTTPLVTVPALFDPKFGPQGYDGRELFEWYTRPTGAVALDDEGNLAITVTKRTNGFGYFVQLIRDAGYSSDVIYGEAPDLNEAFEAAINAWEKMLSDWSH